MVVPSKQTIEKHKRSCILCAFPNAVCDGALLVGVPAGMVLTRIQDDYCFDLSLEQVVEHQRMIQHLFKEDQIKQTVEEYYANLQKLPNYEKKIASVAKAVSYDQLSTIKLLWTDVLPKAIEQLAKKIASETLTSLELTKMIEMLIKVSHSCVTSFGSTYISPSGNEEPIRVPAMLSEPRKMTDALDLLKKMNAELQKV